MTPSRTHPFEQRGFPEMIDLARRTRFRRASAFAVVLAVCVLAPLLSARAAEPLTGDVAGTVTSAGGGPVAGALVVLTADRRVRTQTTDAAGAFAIARVPAGTYVLDVVATGYERPGGRTIEVLGARISRVAVQLVRSTSSLITLGHVTTQAGEALSTSSAPSQDVDAQAYAARGNSSVVDMLAQEAVSIAVVRPAGGSPIAPAAAALRGPDPTETLFEVDGHSLNSGGSGAFDVSLLDAAQLSTVQLVYGIAPSSLIGPNTIDGAVNMRTIDPTLDDHGLYRISVGSFSSFGETIQATGTASRFGYAASLHKQTSRGEANGRITAADGSMSPVGSALAGSTGLAKFRIGVGRNGGSLLVSLRDQSVSRPLGRVEL
jgi:hypothetical protein